MLETPQLFNEIAAALRDRNLEMTRDEIKSLLLECVYYTGRLNAWIDEKIPWSEICSLHDWVQACA
jgi:methionyl-tRNA synthetase